MLKRLGLLFLVCLLCVLVSLWFVLRPQPTVTTAPFRAFETPRLPPHSHNLIRNVAVARLEEPFNGFVALSNGAGGPKLWDVTTGKVIRYLSEQGGPGIALAPLGLPLGLSGGDDGNVILWDLRDGREVRRFEGHSRSVSSVAFSPDGSQVLTGGCDGTVRLFDRRTGKELHCLHGHRSIVMSVAFDPRGRRALSGGWDGTVRTWDLETGKQITLFDGHSGQVWCVACSPNGRWGVSSGTDRMLRLWDVASGREVRRFTGHTDLVAHVSFLPFNRLLFVGGDQSVRAWDVRTGRELYRAPKLSSFGWCAAFLDLNTIPTLVIGTEKNGLQLWRLPQE